MFPNPPGTPSPFLRLAEPDPAMVDATIAYKFDVADAFWEAGTDEDAELVRGLLRIMREYIRICNDDDRNNLTSLIAGAVREVGQDMMESLDALINLGAVRYRAMGQDPEQKIRRLYDIHQKLFEAANGRDLGPVN